MKGSVNVDLNLISENIQNLKASILLYVPFILISKGGEKVKHAIRPLNHNVSSKRLYNSIEIITF